MPWTPPIYSISRPFVVRNLLNYIRTNSAAALLWAKGILSYTGATPDFVEVFNSSAGRVVTYAPTLMLIEAETETPETNRNWGLDVIHTLRFELKVTDALPDNLTEIADVYLVAVDSIIRNVPAETLNTGFTTAGLTRIWVTRETRDRTRVQSSYLQQPDLTAIVRLTEVT